MGRNAPPITSQFTTARKTTSNGVPMSAARHKVLMLRSTWVNETAAITTWPPFAGAATTRSGPGSPYGSPRSRVARPVRTAAERARPESSGTSRSAPGEAAMIRLDAPSTCTVTVPPATGTGSGNRSAFTSAATPLAPCSAVPSTA